MEQQTRGVLRERYYQSLLDLRDLCQKRSRRAAKLQAFETMQSAGVAYFNAHDFLIALGSRTGAADDGTWYTDRAETAENLLDLIAEFHKALRRYADDLDVPRELIKPSPSAYANLQRLVKHHNPSCAAALRTRFEQLGLPTQGFDLEASERPRRERWQDDAEAPRGRGEPTTVIFDNRQIMNNHGNIQGCNVAVGGSSISESSANYESNADLSAALKALKPLVQGVAAEQRQAVEDALRALVTSVEEDSVPREQVMAAAETVVKSSPAMMDRFKEIAGKIGLSLVSSTIFHALKAVVIQ